MKVEISEKRKRCDQGLGEGVVRIVGEIREPIVQVTCDLGVVGACWVIGSSRSGRFGRVMVGLARDDIEELDWLRIKSAVLRMERGVLR